MTWLEEGRRFINQEIHPALAEDATIKDRRAALSKDGWRFHGNTSWGKKIWTRCCREYLERHGLPPRRPASASPLLELNDRIKSGDIVLMGQLTEHSQKGITPT